MNKIIVMQQIVAPDNIGGTSSEYKALINSVLAEKYTFIELRQNITKGLCIKEIIRLYRIIKKSNPDIVHVRGVAIDGLHTIIAAKIYGKCKILLSVHGMYSDLVNISIIKKYIALLLIEPVSYILSDSIYCVCNYAINRKKIKIYGKKVKGVIYNTIPDYDIKNKERIRNDYREKLGIDKDDFIGISVCRITYEKGFSYFIEAMKNMKDKWPNKFRMLVVGEGDYKERLEIELGDLIKERKILVLGKRKDIKNLLFSSDFFITMSLHENHSISLLEASAAKLPVIATDVGGNSEIILNKYNGLLIKSKSSIEIKKAIEFLLMDDYNRNIMAENGYKYCKNKFSEYISLKKLDDIYYRLKSCNKNL